MAAKPYDPLKPLTPKQQRALARRYANAQFGPALAQINQEYDRRARAGFSSIATGTAGLASALAPQAAQTADIYGRAKLEQGQLNESGRAGLVAAGQTAADELARAGYSSSLAAIGAGAGSAGFAMGAADSGRLIAQGAAAENYSSLLPELARLGGLQQGRDLGLQLEHGRQNDLGALRSKIPGTIADIEQQMSAQEFQKATARIGFFGDQAALQQRSQKDAATLSLRAQQQAETRRHNNQMAAKDRAALRERARHNGVTESQQRANEAERARKTRVAEKQRRRQQWYREHSGGKKNSKGSGPPSMSKH
jgi:hypothetical protein